MNYKYYILFLVFPMMINCSGQTRINKHVISNYFFSQDIDFSEYDKIIKHKEGIESLEITDTSWKPIEKTYIRKYKTSDSIVEKCTYDNSNRFVQFERWLQFYGSTEPNKWILNEKEDYTYKIDTIEIKHYNYSKYLDTKGYSGKEIKYLANNKISKIEYYDYLNNLQSIEIFKVVSDTLEQFERKYVKEKFPTYISQTTYDSKGRIKVLKINQDRTGSNDNKFNQIWEYKYNNNDDKVEERYFYDNKLMELDKIEWKYRNDKWIFKKVINLRGNIITLIRKIE